jgi:YesN/AraC family two-component response regulator
MVKLMQNKKLTTEEGLGLLVNSMKHCEASDSWVITSLRPYLDEIRSYQLLPHQFLSVFTQDYLVFVVFDDHDERWCIGPMLFESVEKVQARLKMANDLTLKQLRRVNFSQVKSIGSLVMTYWKDSKTEFEQIVIGDVNIDHSLAIQTTTKTSHAYFNEELNQRLLNLMITGNVDEMREFVKLFDQMSWDHLIQGNPLRSIKNTVITSISRYSFVAINEGLDYATMMKEADELIHRVETSESTYTCIQILKETALRITYLIYEFKRARYSKYTKYVLKKIKTDFNQNLTLAGLALELNISSSHLSRILSSETKQSFHDLLNSERIERAKDFLRQPQNNVAATAQLCGFLYQNHFTQVFKKHTGMTPKEYLRTVSPILKTQSAT